MRIHLAAIALGVSLTTSCRDQAPAKGGEPAGRPGSGAPAVAPARPVDAAVGDLAAAFHVPGPGGRALVTVTGREPLVPSYLKERGFAQGHAPMTFQLELMGPAGARVTVGGASGVIDSSFLRLDVPIVPLFPSVPAAAIEPSFEARGQTVPATLTMQAELGGRTAELSLDATLELDGLYQPLRYWLADVTKGGLALPPPTGRPAVLATTEVVNTSRGGELRSDFVFGDRGGTLADLRYVAMATTRETHQDQDCTGYVTSQGKLAAPAVERVRIHYTWTVYDARTGAVVATKEFLAGGAPCPREFVGDTFYLRPDGDVVARWLNGVARAGAAPGR